MNLRRSSIDGNDFVRIFEIVVDHSFAVGDGLFGSSAKGNGRNDGPLRRVNDRRGLWSAVEDKDPLGCRIVENGVRVAIRLDLADLLECLEIENNSLSQIPIADEPTAKILNQRNSMRSLQAGDLADHFVAIRIQNQELGSVRQVCTAGGRIDRNVIEIFTATFCSPHWNFLDQVVSTCELSGENENAHEENAQYDEDEFLAHKGLLVVEVWEKLSANL